MPSPTPVADHPRLRAYFSMLRAGVPRNAVLQKMRIDGIDAAILALAPCTPVDAALVPVPQPAQATAAALQPASEQPPYQRAFAMLRAGVPRGAVEQRMFVERLDVSVLERGPAAEVPVKTRSILTAAVSRDQDGNSGGDSNAEAAAAASHDPRLDKFRAMLRAGVAREAVAQAMALEHVDASLLDLQPDELVAAVRETDPALPRGLADGAAVAAAEHPAYVRARAMLAAGVPRAAVDQSLALQHLDAAALDRDEFVAAAARAPTALERLIAEPKGKTAHARGEACMLHVFWEVPSAAAARELLAALRGCAVATHRDTPCVPTYFFRVSAAADQHALAAARPGARTVGEHPHLGAALKQLRVGMPRAAVRSELVRKGLDPAWLDLDAGDELPEPLRDQCAVLVECTEIYLDERAFMEHCGSHDYLEAYGQVMKPGLQSRRPRTLRLGTPIASLVEKILEPILQEVVVPLEPGCFVWRRASVAPVAPVCFSLDVDAAASSADAVAIALPDEFRALCTSCVALPHPLREATATVRLLCVLPTLPPPGVLRALGASGAIARGHVLLGGDATSADRAAISAALGAAGLDGLLTVGAEGDCVGHVLHTLAHELHESDAGAAAMP
jgi:hypothetical protein